MPPVSRTERAAEAWEALFRAQVAVMRNLAADDVWDELSMREYDVLFTLGRAPGRRLRLHDLNREILLSDGWLAPGTSPGRAIPATAAGPSSH